MAERRGLRRPGFSGIARPGQSGIPRGSADSGRGSQTVNIPVVVSSRQSETPAVLQVSTRALPSLGMPQAALRAPTSQQPRPPSSTRLPTSGLRAPAKGRAPARGPMPGPSRPPQPRGFPQAGGAPLGPDEVARETWTAARGNFNAQTGTYDLTDQSHSLLQIKPRGPGLRPPTARPRSPVADGGAARPPRSGLRPPSAPPGRTAGRGLQPPQPRRPPEIRVTEASPQRRERSPPRQPIPTYKRKSKLLIRLPSDDRRPARQLKQPAPRRLQPPSARRPQIQMPVFQDRQAIENPFGAEDEPELPDDIDDLLNASCFNLDDVDDIQMSEDEEGSLHDSQIIIEDSFEYYGDQFDDDEDLNLDLSGDADEDEDSAISPYRPYRTPTPSPPGPPAGRGLARSPESRPASPRGASPRPASPRAASSPRGASPRRSPGPEVAELYRRSPPGIQVTGASPRPGSPMPAPFDRSAYGPRSNQRLKVRLPAYPPDIRVTEASPQRWEDIPPSQVPPIYRRKRKLIVKLPVDEKPARRLAQPTPRRPVELPVFKQRPEDNPFSAEPDPELPDDLDELLNASCFNLDELDDIVMSEDESGSLHDSQIVIEDDFEYYGDQFDDEDLDLDLGADEDEDGPISSSPYRTPTPSSSPYRTPTPSPPAGRGLARSPEGRPASPRRSPRTPEPEVAELYRRSPPRIQITEPSPRGPSPAAAPPRRMLRPPKGYAAKADDKTAKRTSKLKVRLPPQPPLITYTAATPRSPDRDEASGFEPETRHAQLKIRLPKDDTEEICPLAEGHKHSLLDECPEHFDAHKGEFRDSPVRVINQSQSQGVVAAPYMESSEGLVEAHQHFVMESISHIATPKGQLVDTTLTGTKRISPGYAVEMVVSRRELLLPKDLQVDNVLSLVEQELHDVQDARDLMESSGMTSYMKSPLHNKLEKLKELPAGGGTTVRLLEESLEASLPLEAESGDPMGGDAVAAIMLGSLDPKKGLGLPKADVPPPGPEETQSGGPGSAPGSPRTSATASTPGSPQPSARVGLDAQEAPWDLELGSLEALLGLSSPEGSISPENYWDRLPYMSECKEPRRHSRGQLRGTVLPDWFPGYYSALPATETLIGVNKSPSIVLKRAWHTVKPKVVLENTEILIA